MSGADSRGGATIVYQPALDGVRALAVIAVLLFHGGVAGFGGGYLGVSVFFTLSGYLITSLLVTEHERTGRVDLATFYGRRLRRLLPASAICLIAVAVIAAATDVFDAVPSLRRQLVGCALQVANWVSLAGEGSYADLLAQVGGAASPVEHFWSLAIEEQFYWVWPPCMVWLMRRRAKPTVGVGAIAAVACVAAPVIAAVWGPDAAYWATPARIGEILVGAFVAVAWHGRTVPARAAWLAPAALAALAVAVVTFPSSSGPAYQGALPLVAVVSALLLVGLQADGPVRTALSWGPLVWLGRISYGVYLFHWPVYVLADERRTGIDGVALLALRLAITLAVATVSMYVVERPIRRATGVKPRMAIGGGAVATAVVAVAALVLAPSAAGSYWEGDQATAEAAALDTIDGTLAPLVPVTETSTVGPTVGPTVTSTVVSTVASTGTTSAEAAPDSTSSTVSTTGTASTDADDATSTSTSSTLAPLPVPPRPVRMLVVGDSTAKAFGTGVVAWAAANPTLAQATQFGAPGCGFVTGGARDVDGTPQVPEGCVDWAERLVYPEVTELVPDVVAVIVSSWDVIDQQFDGGEYVSPLDAEYQTRIRTDYGNLIDGLLAAGAGHVALVRQPLPDVYWIEGDDRADGDPERRQVIFDIYDELAAARPGTVSIVDLDGWFVDVGLATDQAARPDGIHVTPEVATLVANEFLGDRLVRAALAMPTR